VVGSRSATTYGEQVALGLAAGLAAAGVTVVSGAAFGIDVAAHRGALAQRGRTVAVLACGADRAYPAAHSELLRLVSEQGLVVSEVPPGGSPTRHRFLGRNRLIAALTAGTVVVEAAVRSGALNTASWANRLNRPLMGVPGRVTDAPSEGVHELVRSGAATLVARPEHVLELVSPAGTFTCEPPRAEPTARDRLQPADQRVLEAVPLYEPAVAGSIARVAGLSVPVVSDSLTRLRRLGWVTDLDGRWCRSTAPG
jgi:DNA processing protein